MPAVMLEPDVDDIAGLEHLLGGLHVTAFVAVGRRQAREPRKVKTGAKQGEEDIRPEAGRKDGALFAGWGHSVVPLGPVDN